MLIAYRRRAVGEELYQLGAAHNGGARDEAALVQLAPLETWRAHVDHSAGFDEVLHQLSERCETLFVYVIRVALLTQAHRLGAQEHHRVLARRDRGVGHDKCHRRLVAIVLGIGEAHAEFSGSGHAGPPDRSYRDASPSAGRAADIVVPALHVVVHQRFAGQATPCRQVLWRPGIERAHTKHLARAHRLEAETQAQHEIAAAQVSSVPVFIVVRWCVWIDRHRNTRGNAESAKAYQENVMQSTPARARPKLVHQTITSWFTLQRP